MSLLRSFLCLFISALLCLPLLAQNQGADPGIKRIALVIGNSSYANSPLANPVNDAQDMGAALQNLGFEVQVVLDGDRRQMTTAISDFGNKLGPKVVGLFFYAGHGVQINDQNYLIPVHTPIERIDDVEFEAIPLDRVIRTMENARTYMSLVFLDACRDNPFKAGSRAITRGLSVVSMNAESAGAGAMIAYATSPGDVAADGAGRNGVFTDALLKNLASPGVELNQMLIKVRSDVITSSNGRQNPWTNVSLTQEFFFNPANAAWASQNESAGATHANTLVSPAKILPPPPAKGGFTVLNGIGLGLIGSGIASGIVSAVTLFDGMDIYNQYLAATDDADIADLRSQAENASTVGVATLIGAGAGILTGILFQFLGGQ